MSGIGIWHLTFGIWHLACGMWHLACGIWHLAFGIQHFRICEWFSRAVPLEVADNVFVDGWMAVGHFTAHLVVCQNDMVHHGAGIRQRSHLKVVRPILTMQGVPERNSVSEAVSGG